jgi:hypothetical protein
MMRAFNPRSTCPGGRIITDVYNNFGQSPYSPPSVFNFYQANYRPSGPLADYIAPEAIRDQTLVAPEFQILTPGASHRFITAIINDVSRQAVLAVAPTGALKTSCRIYLDFSQERALALSNPGALMSRLDLLLCQGTMSDASRKLIADNAVQATRGVRDLNLKQDLMAEGMTIATLISPECAISH